MSAASRDSTATAATTATTTSTTTAADPVVLPAAVSTVGSSSRAAFAADGFTILPRLISAEFASSLCARLEDVLRGGSSDLGAPDKAPPCRVEGRSKPGKKRLPVSAVPSRRTLQVINVWKADSLFRSLVLRTTGRVERDDCSGSFYVACCGPQ